MNAIKTTIGEKYLSKKGTPVTVVGHKGDKVILKVSGSDNEVPVAKDYELQPYNRAQISKDARHLEQSNGTKTGRKPRGESVSAIIDPLLFAGGKTVKEIAELVTKKAAALAKGRDMEANVRARMVTYSRKGWKVEKNDRKHVKVVKSKS
ncbi:MAG: hypothetical protein KCHDKBKB_01571 [Elusimicrobia bacterium]|nr:hypothetical protein [Elusimicrobiota bacterium]